jgi:exodeoxyribonuclease VII small subunit
MAEEMSFEETLAKLEEVVNHLERGDSMPLDESLQAFEEGIRLTRICRQKLDSAELRVEQLVALDEDNLSTVPFETEENDT